MALCLIDRVGLYNTIFTNPTVGHFALADTEHWYLAYDQLLAIDQTPLKKDDANPSLALIREILLRDSQQLYLAWLLCAFVPWAQATPEAFKKPNAKATPTVAATVAREGIKTDNTDTKIIDNAVTSLSDILRIRSTLDVGKDVTTSSLKRKRESDTREAQGVALRRWGAHWRSSVIFALLVEVKEATGPHGMLQFRPRRTQEAKFYRPPASVRRLC